MNIAVTHECMAVSGEWARSWAIVLLQSYFRCDRQLQSKTRDIRENVDFRLHSGIAQKRGSAMHFAQAQKSKDVLKGQTESPTIFILCFFRLTFTQPTIPLPPATAWSSRIPSSL